MLRILIASLVLLSGCAGLTLEEARTALDEVKLVSQTSALTTSSVEISTNFTIGDAVTAAAEELRDFVQSQLPCAEVTLVGATLTITYGAHAGDCTYHGHTFSGSHSITVERNERSAVQVDHVWTDLSNGIVEVDGSATVTWDFESLTRHVVHASSWTRLADGRIGEGSGDRLQAVLDGNILTGFQVDGERTWDGRAGHWGLDIDGVEMRWIDPVPQAGTYKLETPFGKDLTLRFERLDDTRIQVTVEDPRNSFDFTVSSPGG